jgi:small subunit ribosomal protein S7
MKLLVREPKKMPEIKLFGKWDLENIEIEDPGLKRYISLKPVFIPHSGGRHEHQRFKKSTLNIVERLVNNMMRHGRCGGKKAKAIGIVKNALDIIHLKTGRNPIEVLVKAIENAAPCEDTTRIAYGGIVYPISVDISPQRRVDLALRFISEGARVASFSNPKTIDECLAEEILYAYQKDSRSYSIRKRDEMERIALSSR